MPLRSVWTLPLLLLAIAALPGSARAAGIIYTCDANIDAAVPGTCGTLNGAIAAIYGSVFSNANASIYIQYGNTGLGSSTSGFLNLVSYSTYRNALIAHQGPGTVDAAAVLSLPAAEPSLYSGGNIEITSALAGALGITRVVGGGSVAGTTVGGTACFTPGTGGCYNGIITLATPAILAGNGQGYYYRTGVQSGNQYDIYSVIQHETDEILGTSSCVGTSGSLTLQCLGSNVGAIDLFRYSSANTRSLVSTNPAYFSYDSGNNSVASFNSAANGEDFADFSTSCTHVQDAVGCLGGSLNITSNGGAEVAILDALGFNLGSQSAVPEPGSMVLMGTALAFVIARRRRVKSVNNQ